MTEIIQFPYILLLNGERISQEEYSKRSAAGEFGGGGGGGCDVATSEIKIISHGAGGPGHNDCESFTLWAPQDGKFSACLKFTNRNGVVGDCGVQGFPTFGEAITKTVEMARASGGHPPRWWQFWHIKWPQRYADEYNRQVKND